MLWRWKKANLHTLVTCVEMLWCVSSQQSRFLHCVLRVTVSCPTKKARSCNLYNCWRVPININSVLISFIIFVSYHPFPYLLYTTLHSIKRSSLQRTASRLKTHVFSVVIPSNWLRLFFHTCSTLYCAFFFCMDVLIGQLLVFMLSAGSWVPFTLEVPYSLFSFTATLSCDAQRPETERRFVRSGWSRPNFFRW